jgi:hypothetical protein
MIAEQQSFEREIIVIRDACQGRIFRMQVCERENFIEIKFVGGIKIRQLFGLNTFSTAGSNSSRSSSSLSNCFSWP